MWIFAGTGVLNHKIGDRVGYVQATQEKSGAFSEANILPTSHLIPLPSTITDEEAAALLFPGLTSWMLFKKLRPSNGRDVTLVHGAGTGLGTILTQIAKHMKATVIGTVDSEAEVEAANGRGCDEAIDVSDGSGWGDGVWEMTDCNGVDVVIDLVGLTDFEDVLNLLAPKGTLVCLGNQTPVLNFKQLAGTFAFFPIAKSLHLQQLFNFDACIYAIFVFSSLSSRVSLHHTINRVLMRVRTVQDIITEYSCRDSSIAAQHV